MSRARDLADRVLHNRTHEDTDGGRESIVTFKGEQSGGEISTLAQIQASHDGTADDQKADLIFKTNDGSDGASPTEAIRIDSAQNVGISTATPLSGLHISDGTNAGLPQNANRAATLMIDAGATASADLQFMVRNGYNSHIFFGDTADPNIGMLYYDHTNNDMAFNVNAGEKVRFISEGGITFNGDTAAANALDDYEEGSWTPAITGVTITSGSFTGTYRKVGGIVTVTAYMSNANLSGSGADITGFPFTNSTRTSSSMPSLYNHQHGDKNFNILLESGSTTAYMTYNTTGGWVSAPISAGNARYMNFQITYCTSQ